MADTLFDGAALASSFDDDGERRRRGHDATAAVDGTLTALYYDVPSTGVPSGVGSIAKMYVINDDDEFLAEVDLQTAIPGASPGWTRIDASLFTPAGPVDWPNGARFRGWVATVGDGTPFGKVLFTDPGTFPKVSTPDGHLTCSTGLYGGTSAPPETIPGNITIYWDFDFEFTAAVSTVDGTFQATTGPASLTAAGQLIDPGVATMTVSVGLAVTGGAINAGTVQAVAAPPVLALHETMIVEPGLGTPGGTVLVPTAGGTVFVPTPSGRP